MHAAKILISYLNLRWEHIPGGTFSDVAAQIFKQTVTEDFAAWSFIEPGH